MISTYRHYRGATFRLPATHVDAAGDPASLSGVEVSATLKQGAVESDLTVLTLDEAEGAFTIGATTLQTTEWLPGIWPLYVSYASVAAGVAELDIEMICLIEVKDRA